MVQSASDSCAVLGVGNVVFEQVTSDEADNAPGSTDGNTVNDIQIAADCKSVKLRAERDDTKDGRVYAVTLRVKDASGNTSRKVYKVSVPQRQGSGAAVQGNPVLTKTCALP
jgi:hypothetical protein